MEAVIFIGLQATGKTTFYTRQFARTHIHISMDVLKRRRREDNLLRDCITARQPFVVDNTNVLRQEREKYITFAAEAGYHITGYYFQSSLKDALRRNEQRDGKAVIPVMGIIAKYRALQPPAYEEGFHLLYSVTIEASGQFLVEKIHPGLPAG
jgi:predicted kinase